MAGTAYSTPLSVMPIGPSLGRYPLANGEIVNNGDLVGLNSSGQIVVATNAAGGVVKPVGVCIFDEERGCQTTKTGNSAGTVYGTIYPGAKLWNLNSTLVPGLTQAGQPIYLGTAPTATQTNYTANAPTTPAGTEVVAVGISTSSTAMTVRVPYLRLQAVSAASATLTVG